MLTARVSFISATNSILYSCSILYSNPNKAVFVKYLSGITIDNVTMLDPVGYVVVVSDVSG